MKQAFVVYDSRGNSWNLMAELYTAIDEDPVEPEQRCTQVLRQGVGMWPVRIHTLRTALQQLDLLNSPSVAVVMHANLPLTEEEEASIDSARQYLDAEGDPEFEDEHRMIHQLVKIWDSRKRQPPNWARS